MNDKLPLSIKILNAVKKSALNKFIRKYLPTSLKEGIHHALGTKDTEDAKLVLDSMDGVKIYLPLDRTWSTVISNTSSYEPEIKFVLDKFTNKNSLFIDGGANIGFWSSYASSKIKNPDQVIAVEPQDSVLKALEKNRELSENNFTIVPRAIWMESGHELDFNISNFSMLASLKKHGLGKVTMVLKKETISIDDMVTKAKKLRPNIDNIILKLDLEGGELEAFKGMKGTLKDNNLILIYEDWGNDPKSNNTRHLLGELKMNVYHINDSNMITSRISDAEQLNSVKTDKLKGYNFIACIPGTEFDRQMELECHKLRVVHGAKIREISKKGGPENQNEIVIA